MGFPDFGDDLLKRTDTQWGGDARDRARPL